MRLAATILAAGVAACLGLAARAQEVDVHRGLDYAKHDGVALQGDLYAPKAAGKYPALIAIHGGGWQAGSRDSYGYWGSYLAARGYVVFAASYRFSKPGQKDYPEAVNDVRAAIQFVRGKGETINVDPTRIGLIGDSAGAHLVALVALAGDAAPFAGSYPGDPFATVSTKVKAVAASYGVYDMAQQWEHDQIARPRDQIVEKFLGVAPMENRRLYFEASPMSYATIDNNSTSFLLSYGTEDDIVDRHAQSEAFLLALKQAKFYARAVVVQGAGHFWLSDPIEEPGSYSGFFAPRLLRFLADRL